MALRPTLQLIRLPNVFTAAADSLAGWLLVRGSFAEPARWLPLLAASMAIYAAGIALNDLFDYEIDRVERPDRPLPSGRVSRRFAAGLAATLLVAGAACAFSADVRSGAVACGLIACVIAYDVGLKRTVLGPAIMGACRGLNLLLGMSQAPNLGGEAGWLVAGSLALFVMGLTWISRHETETGRTTGVVAGLVLQSAAFVGYFTAALRWREFPVVSADRPIQPLAGLVLLAIVWLFVSRAVGRAAWRPNPSTIQQAVKTGVLVLVWLDVGIVAAVRGPEQAFAVATLWIPAFVLGKWYYST